ncbi:PepSY domain-containing protein [Marinobacterium sp. YM272]|uniref:PepSY domain-containing protein n=1 Tax=Marinobacterium sp. YM272 TaxID=3421654 RepID=UPI003D7F7646
MARLKRVSAGVLGRVLMLSLPLLMIAPVQAGAAQASSVLAQNSIDLKRAVEIARQAFGGEVVKAEEVVRDGQRLFQIRLVNKGRVRDVLVDALSGQILNP